MSDEMIGTCTCHTHVMGAGFPPPSLHANARSLLPSKCKQEGRRPPCHLLHLIRMRAGEFQYVQYHPHHLLHVLSPTTHPNVSWMHVYHQHYLQCPLLFDIFNIFVTRFFFWHFNMSFTATTSLAFQHKPEVVFCLLPICLPP